MTVGDIAQGFERGGRFRPCLRELGRLRIGQRDAVDEPAPQQIPEPVPILAGGGQVVPADPGLVDGGLFERTALRFQRGVGGL
jgi:hypothetical protein